MQRSASFMAVSGEYPKGTSSKFFARTCGSCSDMGCRGIFSLLGFFVASSAILTSTKKSNVAFQIIFSL
jgi:hypothetical protein